MGQKQVFAYQRDDFAMIYYLSPQKSPCDPDGWVFHSALQERANVHFAYPICVLNGRGILNRATVAIKIMRYIKDTCFK